jgi:DNA-directed RNA polymerase subunit M/transcription elongation factor TFIIS
MALFPPATTASDAIKRPPCPECGTMMILARIEPDKPNHDKRTFECPKCHHSESMVVKFK